MEIRLGVIPQAYLPVHTQLEAENSKLAYQCLHLKRAVQEGDEKLAALQGGK